MPKMMGTFVWGGGACEPSEAGYQGAICRVQAKLGKARPALLRDGWAALFGFQRTTGVGGGAGTCLGRTNRAPWGRRLALVFRTSATTPFACGESPLRAEAAAAVRSGSAGSRGWAYAGVAVGVHRQGTGDPLGAGGVRSVESTPLSPFV